MRPVSRIQLRSVSTPITFVQRGSLLSVRYAATYHLYGRSGPHAACSRLRLRAAARAELPQIGERAVVVRKRRRARLAGDPVDVLAGLRVEHLLAREPRGARAMAVRESAQDDLGDLLRQLTGLRRGQPETARRRLERHRSFGAHAAQPAHQVRLAHLGLSVAPPRRAPPSSRRRRARWSAHGPAPSPRRRRRRRRRRCTSPSRPCFHALPSAPFAQARTLFVSSAVSGRSLNGAPSFPPSGSASRRPNGTGVASGVTRPDSAAASTARPNSRSRLPQSSRGVAHPPSHPNAEAIAWMRHGRAQFWKPWSAQNIRSRKRAEFDSISWPRRLSAEGVPALLHRDALGGEPLRADVGIGQEFRRHDRLDHRARHRVVEHRRIEQRVGPIARRVRHALVAALAASRPVVFLARARRERAGERLDAPGRHVDHRDRGHAHHRLLEHRRADRASGVLAPRHAERAADVLPPGVARDRLLRERLYRGIDREVDGEADVHRRSADLDAVGPVAIAGRRRVRLRGGLGVQPIQRARRLAQRRERLHQRVERGRDLPPLVVRSEGRRSPRRSARPAATPRDRCRRRCTSPAARRRARPARART